MMQGQGGIRNVTYRTFLRALDTHLKLSSLCPRPPSGSFLPLASCAEPCLNLTAPPGSVLSGKTPSVRIAPHSLELEDTDDMYYSRLLELFPVINYFHGKHPWITPFCRWSGWVPRMEWLFLWKSLTEQWQSQVQQVGPPKKWVTLQADSGSRNLASGSTAGENF